MVRGLNYKCGKKKHSATTFTTYCQVVNLNAGLEGQPGDKQGSLVFCRRFTPTFGVLKAQGLSTKKRSCETCEKQIDGGISGEHFARSIFGQIILMIQSLVIQVPDTSLHTGSVNFFGGF